MNFKDIVLKFSNSPTETNMFSLVKYAETRTIEDEEIVLLSETLANSGERLKFKNNTITADIPSTGGPSSLSTILCPLYLVHFGFTVPKLGVPGSPAGAIDVLSQIPGYRINFNKHDLELRLSESRYIHTLADKTFCPLDIKLFEFRKKINKINLFPLVISSLLSKKIALDVKSVGLDIRVSQNGNFGNSIDQARDNAHKFNRIARLLGTSSKCFLTDARFPLQPFIGRGEALLALYEIFEKNNLNGLLEHIEICFSMAASISKKKVKLPFSSINIRGEFNENLLAQGSNYDHFLKKISQLKKQPNIILSSEQEGFLHIDLQKIKSAIAYEQKQFISKNVQFPDPCGCILIKKHGDYIKRKEPLVILRVAERSKTRIIQLIKKSFSTRNIILKTIQYEEVL